MHLRHHLQMLQKNRLEMLSWLYREGWLEIRVGLMRHTRGILHAKYGVVINSDRVAFVVFACETGGRWSAEALALVRALARWRVRDLPPLLRTSFRMAFLRRWWGLLSCTLQDSVAASLDPSDRLLQRGFPGSDR